MLTTSEETEHNINNSLVFMTFYLQNTMLSHGQTSITQLLTHSYFFFTILQMTEIDIHCAPCAHDWNNENVFALILNNPNKSQFYACHDIWAEVACVKLWLDLIIIFHLKATYFYENEIENTNYCICKQGFNGARLVIAAKPPVKFKVMWAF